MLSDWYYNTALNLQKTWFARGPSPIPDSGLINSAGRFDRGSLVPLTRVKDITLWDPRYTGSGETIKVKGLDTFAVLHYDAVDNPGSLGGSNPPDQIFNFTYEPTTDNANRWVINGTSYQPPSLPTLLNILTHTNATFGTNENTFTLKPNATVEILFHHDIKHPFHLHGHVFDVIQSVDGGPPNYKNPPRRDTVTAGLTLTGAPTRIRFRTDNPGPRFLHCHIDWDFEDGLAVVFAEDLSGIRNGSKAVRYNPEWDRPCDIYDKLSSDLR
ncbi:hypothetical protein Clacol_004953 [Clathrus columnatus]|uniref:Plastocyanin-like domain-containing protein n=1 Tax=Clathrus columnatus TaxID=1419009 RepID=A0AAV5A7X5_9AGAM|nr:hypothetical protein Clacol_004953 [Clathrus columnatus]